MTTESSSDDDDFIIPTISMPEFDAIEQLIVNTINRNNMLIGRYSNQQNIERPGGGSILGHAFINRNREVAVVYCLPTILRTILGTTMVCFADDLNVS